jgi:hypothetical protein
MTHHRSLVQAHLFLSKKHAKAEVRGESVMDVTWRSNPTIRSRHLFAAFSSK